MAIPLSYNLRNLSVRWTTTVMTAVGIGLTVTVMVSILGLVEGLHTSLAATGNPRHVLVMRKGSTSELTSTMTRQTFQDLRFTPGILRSPSGDPLASLEMVTVMVLESPDRPEGMNITLRGLLPVGFTLREQLKVVEGRKFLPGNREVIVGKSISDRYPKARIGRTLRFGRGEWTVVGVFDSGLSAANSEVFADLDQVSADFFRSDILSSVLARTADETAARTLVSRLSSDRRFSVLALTEREYYEQQTKSGDVVKILGFIVAAIMAVGSSFAAMNTMYAAVSRRAAEIGTLRVLGFTRGSILLSFFLESVFLSLLGGTFGCLLALPLNLVQAGIGNWVTFSEITFAFHVGPKTMAEGLAFAMLMGVVGGLLPARMAASKEIVIALRET